MNVFEILILAPFIFGAIALVITPLALLVAGRREIWKWINEHKIAVALIPVLTLLSVAVMYQAIGILAPALIFSLMAAAFATYAYVTGEGGGYFLAIGIVVLVVGMLWIRGMDSESNLAERTAKIESAQQLSNTNQSNLPDPPRPPGTNPSDSLHGSPIEPEPTYSDERWPTTNSELLAIPEADRWYNSYKRVGSRGTIAGPVMSVVPLDNRVMVNIGNDYPDPDRAQIVIWSEDVSDFAEMLDEIDSGRAWISMKGRISSYDEVAEIDVGDGPVKYTWWTDVR